MILKHIETKIRISLIMAGLGLIGVPLGAINAFDYLQGWSFYRARFANLLVSF